MTPTTRLAFAVAAAFLAPLVPAAQHHSEPKPAECESVGLDCALFAMPVFDGDAVWLAWSSRNGVFVAKSTDGGRTFPPGTAVVTPLPNLDGGADTRPQLLVLPNRTVLVGYSIFKDDKYNGQVLVARSTDGGRTFGPPRPVTNDPSSQRFLSLSADSSGGVFATWIDKRLVAAARARGEDPAGAALAYAWSRDGGATFDEARIAVDTICECCRLGAVFAQPGRPAILFRNIYGGERDHALLTFEAPDQPGVARRVAEDHWAIDGCPHHGPSLAIAEGVQHAVWFTGGEARQGAFYARSTDGGRTFSAPRALTAGHNATRPFVAALGSRVWTVWKEIVDGRTVVLLSESADRGATWSAPRAIADAAGFSDHPLLVPGGGRMHLSWLTRERGYVLAPLDRHPSVVRR